MLILSSSIFCNITYQYICIIAPAEIPATISNNALHFCSPFYHPPVIFPECLNTSLICTMWSSTLENNALCFLLWILTHCYYCIIPIHLPNMKIRYQSFEHNRKVRRIITTLIITFYYRALTYFNNWASKSNNDS